MGKSTISMVIFNSYFDITRGYTRPYQTQIQISPGIPDLELIRAPVPVPGRDVTVRAEGGIVQTMPAFWL